MWIYAGLSCFIFLNSCVSNNVLADAHAADNNVNRLSRISLRMNEEEVLAIMHAPYEKETYRVGIDRYEIWFYVTTVTVLGQSRMVPKNLTPLTFRNKQLVGVGYDYYHWVQKREPSRQQPVPINQEAEDKEPEDKELEQQLKNDFTPDNRKNPQKQQPNGAATSPSNRSQPIEPAQPAQPSPSVPAQKPARQQPSNSPPSDLKLGPPPYTPASKPKTEEPPAKQPVPSNTSQTSVLQPEVPAHESTMSRKPDGSLEPSSDKSQEKKAPTRADSDRPEREQKPNWDEKDEEINEDAMDQDFNYW
jgi:hypothetical protein